MFGCWNFDMINASIRKSISAENRKSLTVLEYILHGMDKCSMESMDFEYLMENTYYFQNPTLISGEFWQCFNSYGCFCRLCFVLENALIDFTKGSLAQSSEIIKYLFLRISLCGAATHLTRTRFSRSTSLRSCMEQLPPANS